MTAYDWSAANCRTVDPETMQSEHASAEDVAEATAVCGKGTAYECPLLAQCRELADSQEAPGDEEVGPYGVHAGEWRGAAPKAPRVTPCEWCGGEVHQAKTGRRRWYCGATCRKAANRARDLAGTAA